MSYLKLQVSFSLNFESLFNVMGDTSSVQNFRLFTAQVKFHQICTLIGYLLKAHKVSAKKSMEEIYLMIPNSGAKFEEKLFFSKTTRIW